MTSTEYGVACSLPRRASPRSLRTRGKKKVCTSHRANWPNFTDSRAAHRSWAPVQPHQPQPQPRPPNQWPPPLTCHGRPPQRRWQSVDERGAPPGAAGPRPQHPRQARPKGHLTGPPPGPGRSLNPTPPTLGAAGHALCSPTSPVIIPQSFRPATPTSPRRPPSSPIQRSASLCTRVPAAAGRSLASPRPPPPPPESRSALRCATRAANCDPAVAWR